MSSASTKDMGEIDVTTLKPSSRRAHEERAELEARGLSKVDGRTLRRRGRTVTFSTKTTPDTIKAIQRIAMAENLTMVEVLERAIEIYAKSLRGDR